MVKAFRVVGFLEAVSFLVLLLIAMPLKYVYGMPLAVRIAGSAHGALFVAYTLLLIKVSRELNWSLKTSILAFLGAFVPFGPFIVDRKLLS